MHRAGDLIKLNPSEQTKPFTKNTHTYAHSDETFDMVWRGLQAGRFISKDDVIGGVDYNYWRHNLADLTDEQLMRGYEGSKDCTDYMTWSVFRNLCVEQKLINAPMYREYKHKALPLKPIPNAEWRKRTAKMREELGL
jgi:hypothetical protein